MKFNIDAAAAVFYPAAVPIPAFDKYLLNRSYTATSSPIPETY